MKIKITSSAAVALVACAALSASASAAMTITATHSGSAAPTTQGWTRVDTGGGATVGAVTTPEAAWRVTDNSITARTFYRDDLSAGEQTAVTGSDWNLTTRIRVIDLVGTADDDPNQISRIVSYVTPGNSTTGKEFGLRFGITTDSTRMIVTNFDGTQSFTLADNNFHTFDLRYNANTLMASLFIDGSTSATFVTSGISKNSAFGTDSFVRFGSPSTLTTGAAEYASVTFTIIPEPSTAALLCGCFGVLALRRRRR